METCNQTRGIDVGVWSVAMKWSLYSQASFPAYFNFKRWILWLRMLSFFSQLTLTTWTYATFWRTAPMPRVTSSLSPLRTAVSNLVYACTHTVALQINAFHIDSLNVLESRPPDLWETLIFLMVGQRVRECLWNLEDCEANAASTDGKDNLNNITRFPFSKENKEICWFRRYQVEYILCSLLISLTVRTGHLILLFIYDAIRLRKLCLIASKPL